MEARTLTYIAEGCQGELRSGQPEKQIRRVCTDSRRVQPGDLFIALAGERFDGHDYLTEAARLGVAAVMAETNKTPLNMPGCAVIEVAQTRVALGRLATRYRRDFDLPIIAVCGSNGKTTTKEILAAVLRQRRATLRSEASFNNDIGVPLTLLQLEHTHQAAVVEAGTNHPGELAPLIEMIKPRYGICTSLGREHLEFFGDLTGVAAEEGWLAELLPADGKLFVQGDSHEMRALIRRASAPVATVGQGPGNDWRLSALKMDDNGTTFWVEAANPGFQGEYRLNLLGKHQAINALFAIALGAELGLDREEVQRGLEECQAPKMRLQVWNTRGIRVLDDAYNANADSMVAALETMRDLPCSGRRVAVLGDMAELGRHSQAAHEEVGRRAAALGINALITVGQWAPVLGAAARAAGLLEVKEFAEKKQAAMHLQSYMRPGDVVLLKASRAAQFEDVAEAIKTGGAAEKLTAKV